IIRVGMQVRAVVHSAQGIEGVRIDAVLDAVDRAVAEQGVDPGGVSRPEDSPGISIIAVRLLQVLIPSRVGYPRVSSIRQGRVVPEARAARVVVFRAGKWSIVVITAIAEVIPGLNKFFGNSHGVGAAIAD